MILYWLLSGCTGAEQQSALIQIDGSSTVFPITEAVAEDFQRGRPSRVTIGVSGTGGGFKKLCRGETDIIGASRPITDVEKSLCAEGGVGFIELPMAYDGIAVVIHPENDWSTEMTVGQLKTIWQPEAQGKIMAWNQIDPAWPSEEMHLYGPGVSSGTYDYFTKAIVGKQHASRGDVTSSEDDNVLVQGVARDRYAMGFFGLAYYTENQEKVRAIAINDGDDSNGAGFILPSLAAITDGTYQPLNRPIFLYVSANVADRKEIGDFISFYLSAEGQALVREVGYVPLATAEYTIVKKRFDDRVTGSLFTKDTPIGMSIRRVLEGGQ
ncbi:MAG: PstS family phosphate ABC transporter substrate-binding protein [Myxococcota bacterium]